MARIWDTLRGRKKAAGADFDGLFSLPSAAITLQASADFTSTGMGAICFRSAAGPAFAATMKDVVALLDNDDDPDVEQVTDEFGFTWLISRQNDVGALVTDLHAVSTGLEAQGFTNSLLCALLPFADQQGHRIGLVYLYKQGTFYPFVPTGPRTRDNVEELRLRTLLSTDLRFEVDLTKWMALWGAPGL